MANFLKRLFSGDPKLRTARFAGILYPAKPDELGQRVGELLEAAPSPSERSGRAVIVPHSELDFSGPVAAHAFAAVARPRRIVLLGPSQRVPFRGVAATSSEGFDTPLGWLEVEREAYAPIVDFPFARQLEDAHDAEPSIELQLPFLKRLFDDVPIVPLVVGDASIADLETIIDVLWQDDVLVVVSSELSRGLPHEQALEVDARTASLIAKADVEGLDDREMSGRRIVQALVSIASERGMKIDTLALRNSVDSGGPVDSTVGYGAFVVS